MKCARRLSHLGLIVHLICDWMAVQACREDRSVEKRAELGTSRDNYAHEPRILRSWDQVQAYMRQFEPPDVSEDSDGARMTITNTTQLILMSIQLETPCRPPSENEKEDSSTVSISNTTQYTENTDESLKDAHALLSSLDLGSVPRPGLAVWKVSSDADKALLYRWGTQELPAIKFLVLPRNSNLWYWQHMSHAHVEYGLLHMLTRAHVQGQIHVEYDQEFKKEPLVWYLPRVFENPHALQVALKRHQPLLRRLGALQDNHVEWLPYQIKDTRDTTHIVAQCRLELDETFAKLAHTFVAHRRVHFVTITDDCPCHAEDEYVLYTIGESSWTLPVPQCVPATTTAVFRLLQPKVLYLDRQATAPILFSPHSPHKVHLCIVVDTSEHAELIRALHAVCERPDAGVMGMVLDYRENRVIQALGLDIWSHSLREEDVGYNPLPAAVLVDNRDRQRTRRYILPESERTRWRTASEDVLSTFVNHFWEKTLTPIMQSSHDAAFETDFGVEIHSATTLQQALKAAPEQHALLLLTNPTCGHCKRFTVLWNELADLRRAYDWSSWLRLMQVDVSVNDLVDTSVQVNRVPDLWYFRQGHRKRFAWKDQFNYAGVGRLSDVVEVLQWLFYEGDFSDDELRALWHALQDDEEELEEM